MLTVNEAVVVALVVSVIFGAMVSMVAYIQGRHDGRMAGLRYMDGLLAEGALRWAPPKPGEPHLVLVRPARGFPGPDDRRA